MKIYAYGFEIDIEDRAIFKKECTHVVISESEAYWSDGGENKSLTAKQKSTLKDAAQHLHIEKYGVGIGKPFTSKTPSEIMSEIEADPNRDDIMFKLIVLNYPLSMAAKHIKLFKTK